MTTNIKYHLSCLYHSNKHVLLIHLALRTFKVVLLVDRKIERLTITRASLVFLRGRERQHRDRQTDGRAIGIRTLITSLRSDELNNLRVFLPLISVNCTNI